MNAFYNDPATAAWLRQLIADGLIEKGTVDERDIREVQPGDLAGYGRCHFFAGIGGWDYALRLAGWSVDRPVWTGSCPCQPFSAAGKRQGEKDPRHLWPEFVRLIAACRPPVVFGEQVASADGREWLSGVRVDLEALAYEVGAADLCAAGVAAPHMRQRLYWVAHSDGNGFSHRSDAGPVSSRRMRNGRLADANGRQSGDGGLQPGGQHGQRAEDGGVGGLGDAARSRERRPCDGKRKEVHGQEGEAGGSSAWGDFRVIPCRDGKLRRIAPQPEFFPLAHGVPARLVRIRGYGNAIVPQLAAEFVMAYLEAAA